MIEMLFEQFVVDFMYYFVEEIFENSVAGTKFKIDAIIFSNALGEFKVIGIIDTND